MALISDLPIDVLACILGRLCLRDYIRCRTVCSGWNSVVSRNPNPRQVPWLLLPRTEADEANEICRFYDFYHGVEFTVAIPGVRWCRCIGSSDGWLMILDDFSELSMFNPLTGIRIALPSITTFPDVEPVFKSSGRFAHYRIKTNYLTSDPPFVMTAHRTCSLYFYKAFVMWSSDSSYTVVAICGYLKLFAFARTGDEAWSVKVGESYPFEDAIFHEGQFYTAGASGTVESRNLNGPFPMVKTVAVDLKKDSGEKEYSPREKKYLVEISGNLFEVLRVVDRTISFKVYKIDRDADKGVAVKSLGHHALFLGDNYSIAVSKRDFPALKENCIYFLNDYSYPGENETRYLGVFNLEDGSVESIYSKGSQQTWPRPIWFVPNLSHTT